MTHRFAQGSSYTVGSSYIWSLGGIAGACLAVVIACLAMVVLTMATSRAQAQALGYAGASSGGQVWLGAPQMRGASFAPQIDDDETALAPDNDVQSPRLRRQIVALATREAPGTIIIDTGNTHLYYVLGNGRAVRYGVGVGREGFTWAGVQNVSRKAEWPDWIPPAEMIARQPYLPRWVGGGPGNPLGARALYLGGSIYRIHGTNDPTTIGQFVSSGCIRMTNEDVADLYNRVTIGTKVVVLPVRGAPQLEAQAPVRPAQRIVAAPTRGPVLAQGY